MSRSIHELLELHGRPVEAVQFTVDAGRLAGEDDIDDALWLLGRNESDPADVDLPSEVDLDPLRGIGAGLPRVVDPPVHSLHGRPRRLVCRGGHGPPRREISALNDAASADDDITALVDEEQVAPLVRDEEVSAAVACIESIFALLAPQTE